MSSLLLLLFGFFLARVESLAELGAGISWLCAVAPSDEAARQHVRRRRLLCKARWKCPPLKIEYRSFSENHKWVRLRVTSF